MALKKSVVYDYGRLGYANTIMYVCMYLDIYTAPIKSFLWDSVSISHSSNLGEFERWPRQREHACPYPLELSRVDGYYSDALIVLLLVGRCQ